ncbi:MAG: alpha/beta hydrolase [Desulfobacteraceae bacterium 4572_89]|nr:MAG: alpha/beta hydrolase [Desulfobacteraceae bacterium 4572_89]
MEKFQNYGALDQAYVLERLFHPRREDPGRLPQSDRVDVMIPVGQGVELGASFYFNSHSAPIVLFFHGNGEIVSDYDDLGQYFTRAGLNFFVVDYRGYGRSSGLPEVSSMMTDSHVILDFLISYKEKNHYTGPVCIMGRSLGSAPALELAVNSGHEIHCLIIESGFAFASPLLGILGIDPVSIGFREEQGFENLEKIKRLKNPCLIIHAEFDHIIPFSDGQALYDACPSSTKFLLEIKGANHNDIFFRGMIPYLEQVGKFCFMNPGGSR